MNKLTKLMLASAMMITSGFAQEPIPEVETKVHEGLVNVKGNGVFEVSKMNHTFGPGSELKYQDPGEEETTGSIVVDEDRVLTIAGGTFTGPESASEPGTLTVAGKVEIKCGKDSTAPCVDLRNVAVQGVHGVRVSENGNVCVPGNWKKYDHEVYDNGMLVGKAEVILEGKNDGKAYALYSDQWYYGGGYTDVSLEGYGNMFVFDRDMLQICGKFGSEYPWYLSLTKCEVVKTTGEMDLSGLRTDSGADALEMFDASNVVKNIGSSGNMKVTLPTNCKFENVDLSDASKVSYVVLKVGELYKVGVEGKTVKHVSLGKNVFVGDYSTEADLGVKCPDSTCVSKNEVEVAEWKPKMSLSELINNTEFNKLGNELMCDEVVGDDHVNSNACLNFGLIGSFGCNFSEGVTITFNGDNSAVTGVGNLDNMNAIFGGSNSLLPCDLTLGEVVFAEGSVEAPIENEVAEGTTVEISNFEIQKHHTLNVKGRLIV